MWMHKEKQLTAWEVPYLKTAANLGQLGHNYAARYWVTWVLPKQ